MTKPDKIWAGTAFGADTGVDWSTKKAFQMDVPYLLSTPAREHAEELVEALEFYANVENWRLNGPLDVNSPRFDGESRASNLLAKIKEQTDE